MTRPIEFRAWDGKQMLTTRDRCFVEFDGDIWQNKGGAYSHDDLSELDVQLMQFTGLTDKNGVKIFESDIVRLCYYECDEEPELNSYTVHEVIWGGEQDYPAFDLKPPIEEMNGLQACFIGCEGCPIWCEVIGNIHEHSELLEAK